MNKQHTAQTITIDRKTFDDLVSALKCCVADLEGLTSNHREECEQSSIDEATRALAAIDHGSMLRHPDGSLAIA